MVLGIPNQTVKRLMYGYLRDAWDDMNVFSTDFYDLFRLTGDMAYEGAWRAAVRGCPGGPGVEPRRRASVHDRKDGMKIRELQPRRPAAALPGAGGANSPVSRYPETGNVVYRFGVHLRGTDPPVWRLIDVPAEYRFWDLHVAIQDAMGWLDYHLHEFSIIAPDSGKPVSIGTPASDFGYENDKVLRDSECAIADYFRSPGDEAIYIYDLGDGWQHRLALSRVLPREPGVRYPVCRDGERACPPEDCGGVGGFRRFLDIMADPDHKEHKDTQRWLIDHVGRYYPYDPEDFDPATVDFDDPQERWLRAWDDR